MSSKLKVLVSVPNLGEIDRYVVLSLYHIERDDRFEVKVCYPSASPSENTRAYAMRDFLEGDYDYWLSIDADNPPTGNPLDLIDHDFDLVALPTPVWQHGDVATSLHWNIYEDRGEDGFAPLEPKEGGDFEEVGAIGSGCFLAARRVFAKLKDAQPFVRVWGDDGIAKVGSDLSMSRKVRAAGFKIMAAWNYLCRHYSSVDLLEVYLMMARQYDLALAEVAKRAGDGLGQLRARAGHDESSFTPSVGLGWSAFDDMAVELETCEVLYSLVRTNKPSCIVESGTGQGYATLAMAQALVDNKARAPLVPSIASAHIWSYEPDEDFAGRARKRLEGYPASVLEGDEVDQLARNPDMVFLDSGPDRRVRELEFWLKEGGVFLVVHDAFRYRDVLKNRGLMLTSMPRGLFLGDLR